MKFFNKIESKFVNIFEANVDNSLPVEMEKDEVLSHEKLTDLAGELDNVPGTVEYFLKKCKLNNIIPTRTNFLNSVDDVEYAKKIWAEYWNNI